MAADLLEAVRARLLSTLSGSLPGGVWFGLAPNVDATGQPVAMPYGVITEVGSTRQHAAKSSNATSYFDDGTFQVSVFATGRTQAVAIGNQVMTTLNDASLTFDAGTLTHLRQSNHYTELDPGLGVGGKSVVQEIREFRYIVAGEF